MSDAIDTLDRLVCDFCVAVGEPVPVDAIDAIKRWREALRKIVWAENRGPNGAAESAFMVQVARDALAGKRA